MNKEEFGYIELEKAVRALLFSNKNNKGTVANRLIFEKLHEACKYLDAVKAEELSDEECFEEIVKE